MSDNRLLTHHHEPLNLQIPTSLGTSPEYYDRLKLQPLVREISWTKAVLQYQVDNKSYGKYLLNQTSFNQTLGKLGGKHVYMHAYMYVQEIKRFCGFAIELCVAWPKA